MASNILSFPPCCTLLYVQQEPSRSDTCAAPMVQKYRLYLKRVQGVQPGSRGNSGASPSMLHGHDSSLFSHGLGSSDQVWAWWRARGHALIRECSRLLPRLRQYRTAGTRCPSQLPAFTCPAQDEPCRALFAALCVVRRSGPVHPRRIEAQLLPTHVLRRIWALPARSGGRCSSCKASR